MSKKIASFAASERAIYSDSIVDIAMTDCFELWKEIMPFAMKKSIPEVDLRSSGLLA